MNKQELHNLVETGFKYNCTVARKAIKEVKSARVEEYKNEWQYIYDCFSYLDFKIEQLSSFSFENANPEKKEKMIKKYQTLLNQLEEMKISFKVKMNNFHK